MIVSRRPAKCGLDHRIGSAGGELAPGGEVRSGWKGRGMRGSGISRKNAEPINMHWDKLKIRLGIRVRST